MPCPLSSISCRGGCYRPDLKSSKQVVHLRGYLLKVQIYQPFSRTGYILPWNTNRIFVICGTLHAGVFFLSIAYFVRKVEGIIQVNISGDLTADVKKFFHTPEKRCHTRIVLEELLRAGECVTDRAAGTRGIRSPGHGPGRSHNNNWLSRAAKIFPGSEEPGKFFAFRSSELEGFFGFLSRSNP